MKGGTGMEIKVDIFSGFLGAGKTMLIKKLINENAYGSNIAIIENEFGEVGIDGAILKETNIEVKEINSGCICCQVSGKFGDAVIEVINKYKPEVIIIEPSGVAKLTEILNVLGGIKFDGKISVRNIFTLIDIQNYDIYLNNFKEFYENQIKKANKIVLSRSQFVDEEKINKTIQSIKKYNSTAEIFYKPWYELNAFDIVNSKINNVVNDKKVKFSKISSLNVALKKGNHTAKEVFESYPIDLMRNANSEELKKKFEFIYNSGEKFGTVLRAKGIAEGTDGVYYQFDYVPNEFKSRPIRWSNRKVVSIIGSNLNKEELKNFLK